MKLIRIVLEVLLITGLAFLSQKVWSVETTVTETVSNTSYSGSGSGAGNTEPTTNPASPGNPNNGVDVTVKLNGPCSENVDVQISQPGEGTINGICWSNNIVSGEVSIGSFMPNDYTLVYTIDGEMRVGPDFTVADSDVVIDIYTNQQ